MSGALSPNDEGNTVAAVPVGDAPSDLLRAHRLIQAAARLLGRTGMGALRMGQPGTAAELLSRAYGLSELGGVTVPDLVQRAELLDSLLTALTQAGLVHDAEWAGRVEDLEYAGLDAPRLAVLQARLAWMACTAGDFGRAAAWIARARATGPGARCRAVVNAVAGQVAAGSCGGGEAVDLGRAALAVAEAEDLPDVACQAWEVLGIVARRRDTGESTACFARMESLARRRGLAYWGLLAQFHLGTDECLTSGDTARLERVSWRADRLGAAAIGCSARAVVALDRVLRGRYAEAGDLIDRCYAEAGSLGLGEVLRGAEAMRAVLAAHQGRRAQMDAALEELRERSGVAAGWIPLAAGLASAFRALLREDRTRARAVLDEAAARQAAYPITGSRGLRVLLAALSDGDEAETVPDSDPVRWNRQFVLFARAVRLGREGQSGPALEAVAQAERAAAPYPLARHLGLRLVAEAAHRDGWGHPAEWLHQTDEYFHAAAPAVAGAARSLLRQTGASRPARCDSRTAVPARLRASGVTPREYEVLQLLAPWSGNRAIAEQLYISHRTVEKHVASLLMKLAQPNRMALAELATQLPQG